MTDEHKKPADDQVSETMRLEQATDELASSDDAPQSTLVSIPVGNSESGQHNAPTQTLEPDAQPSPNQPQSSQHQRAATPASGTLASSGGQTGGSRQAVAPFGGRIMVGSRLGQIEVTGVLGKGGMGEVFRGYHHALDIDVAIKVLPDELSRNELVRQRFLREARLCVKLDHPHIVRVYNVDEHAGNLFLVMECIDGADAAGMLKDGGRFRYRRALEICAASADALAYAHSQGLVHRDIKPHNILLSAADHRIKLSDFGLARAASSSSHLTMSGQIMGTPHYMSPEQAESKEVTDKSDVYSLGITLYHMLTGETPFIGDTPISVAVQHIAKQVVFPEERFKAFPKELVSVLKRMVAKDPEKRCSAKQASVWLKKLIGMAPADDVAVKEDAAVTLAPVVRESQAFEAARQDRERRNEEARVAAQTLMATMQERPAPNVMQATMQESSNAVQPTPVATDAPKKGGTGKLVAALFVLVLLGGGGAAAWYFTVGPGAKQANQPVITKDDGGDSDSDGSGDGTGGGGDSGSASTDGSGSGGVVGDGSGDAGTDAGGDTGSGDGGSDTGGDTGGDTGSDDGGSDTGGDTGGDTGSGDGSGDTGSDTGGGSVDDDYFAAKLDAANAALNAASDLNELKDAEKAIDAAKSAKSRASDAQLKQLAKTEALYALAFATMATQADLDTIDDVLAKMETIGGDDEGATKELNRGLAVKSDLESRELPSDVEAQMGDRRDDAIKALDDALGAWASGIESDASELADKSSFGEAAERLGVLQSLNVSDEQKQAWSDQADIYETQGGHKRVRAQLGLKRYRDAQKELEAIKKSGVPESLSDEHDALVQEVATAIQTAFDALLADADQQLKDKKYDEARNALDSAGDLPLATAHLSTLADRRFDVDLVEILDTAETYLNDNDLTQAHEALTRGEAKINKPGDRVVAAGTKTRAADLRASFDKTLATTFAAILDDAGKLMKSRNFDKASAKLETAAKLPLTGTQTTELEEFKTANKQALEDFFVKLLAEGEKALDNADFATATERIQTLRALTPPDEVKERFSKLQARFDQVALERHQGILDAATKALDAKKYIVARDEIAKLKDIPVSEAQAKKGTDLEARWLTEITDGVEARFKAADKLLDEEDYSAAKSEIEGAQLLALTPELGRRCKQKMESWTNTIESLLTGHLDEAKTARQNGNFRISAHELEVAEKLPLDQAQLLRLSEAQDEHAKVYNLFISGLFKELQTCVDRGDELKGKKLIEKLERQDLTSMQKRMLNNLSERLEGDTTAQRLAKLPRHLRRTARGRYMNMERYFSVGENITAITSTSTGKYAAFGTTSGRVYFYNLKRGTKLGQSQAGRRKITAIAMAPDGTNAVCGNDEGALVMFSLDGAVRPIPMASVDDGVLAIAYSHDGREVLVSSDDDKLTRFKTSNRQKSGAVINTGVSDPRTIAVDVKGRWVAVGGDSGEVAIFSASSFNKVETLQTPDEEHVQRVQFSQDGSQLVVAAIGSDIAVWKTSSWKTAPTTLMKEGLPEWARGAGFSADGHRVVAFDSEEKLCVWDSSRGTKLKEIKFEKWEKDKTIEPSSGYIGPDGTVLIGTGEGEIYFLTIKNVR